MSGTNLVGQSSYTYDSATRVTNIDHKDSASNHLSDITYAYDLASRLTSENVDGTTQTFTYDGTNQVTQDSARTYTYDLAGNRTMTAYGVRAANRLTSDPTWTSYTYDAEG